MPINARIDREICVCTAYVRDDEKGNAAWGNEAQDGHLSYCSTSIPRTSQLQVKDGHTQTRGWFVSRINNKRAPQSRLSTYRLPRLRLAR